MAVKERPRLHETGTHEDGFRTVVIRRLKKKPGFKSHLFVYLVVKSAPSSASGDPFPKLEADDDWSRERLPS